MLAGDHLKASSDLGIPLVGVGLLYAEGYFHQQLNADGWQEEINLRIDPPALGVQPTGIQVSVDLAGVDVQVRVWRVDVGCIPLYLLDTNVPDNPPEAIAVTNRLYGGDEQHRLRQEIILGIGGVRALRALGLAPQVFHTNEGHAGFLGLERVREWTEQGLSFDEAIEAVRAGGLFTTHTPVPAGIDRFPRDLFEPYFDTFAKECGVTFDELFELGQRDDEPDGKFNMAVMGLRLAARSNGVAKLHGDVSREMFGGMWPALPSSDAPIGHVTNGVHARHVGRATGSTSCSASRSTRTTSTPAPRSGPACITSTAPRSGTSATPGARNWSRWCATCSATTCSTRTCSRSASPDASPRTSARRCCSSSSTGSRRCCSMPTGPCSSCSPARRIPPDQPGKAMIQRIHQLASEADVRHRFVLIPDYDIGIARTMYHGCDVWLNTPRRPMEACGTSGMKAALNGVLNCSILDGWWDEMTDGTNGFDIPSFEADDDLARRDHREANATFDVIESQIVPLFYDRNDDGVPHRWIERLANNWATMGWNVTASRMVRDYVTELYEPAAAAADARTSDGAAGARDLAGWKAHVNDGVGRRQRPHRDERRRPGAERRRRIVRDRRRGRSGFAVARRTRRAGAPRTAAPRRFLRRIEADQRADAPHRRPHVRRHDHAVRCRPVGRHGPRDPRPSRPLEHLRHRPRRLRLRPRSAATVCVSAFRCATDMCRHESLTARFMSAQFGASLV